MTVQHGQQRSSEIGSGSERSKPESESRSMGAFRSASEEYGAYQIRASGEDSREPNIVGSSKQPSETIPGKILSQLIDETEKQLAYHEQQAELLRERLTELKTIQVKE